MELWYLHLKGDLPKVVSPRHKLLCPMTNNTLQHGLSEIYIFLILGLDFIAAIAKTGPAFRKILVLSIIAFKILKDLTIKKVGKSC